jgi:hypothetical protein
MGYASLQKIQTELYNRIMPRDLRETDPKQLAVALSYFILRTGNDKSPFSMNRCFATARNQRIFDYRPTAL